MLKIKKMKFAVLASAAFLGGCVSASNVYEMSPGTFTVTATGDGYTTADRVMDLAMTKAQQQCSAFRKRINVIDQRQTVTRMGYDTTIALDFRCV